MTAEQVTTQLVETGRIGMMDARAHLPAIVAHVAAGGAVTLTNKGRPVAEFRPVRES